jgi:hypothetical protein
MFKNKKKIPKKLFKLFILFSFLLLLIITNNFSLYAMKRNERYNFIDQQKEEKKPKIIENYNYSQEKEEDEKKIPHYIIHNQIEKLYDEKLKHIQQSTKKFEEKKKNKYIKQSTKIFEEKKQN